MEEDQRDLAVADLALAIDYLMRANGTRIRRLTRNSVPDLVPDWQPIRDETGRPFVAKA